MELVDPRKIRLQPGQSIEGMFANGPGEEREVGLFLRSASGSIRQNGDLGILQRAGLIRFNDVLLVLTMLRLGTEVQELFDVWWNYHSNGGVERFHRMSEQDMLPLHFYGEGGKEFSVDTKNSFQKFFRSLPDLLDKAEPWTGVEFDRAVRGFCAQSYPKENLWEIIEVSDGLEKPRPRGGTIDDYPGVIPDELYPFYTYEPDQGHCIKIIPSMLEDEALQADPDQYLLSAPVKTVLRCGYRWMKGFPVAPIPYLPGHGLAVPPEDTEL
jgi:hypothetical protein